MQEQSSTTGLIIILLVVVAVVVGIVYMSTPAPDPDPAPTVPQDPTPADTPTTDSIPESIVKPGSNVFGMTAKKTNAVNGKCETPGTLLGPDGKTCYGPCNVGYKIHATTCKPTSDGNAALRPTVVATKAPITDRVNGKCPSGAYYDFKHKAKNRCIGPCPEGSFVGGDTCWPD